MTGGVLGGGVIFVVAALLWAAVLVPAWTRRREFRAAEKNALRLQRTLRILAETAEVPQEVRLEATAREALAHEKLLRTAQRQQEAERAADLAEARAASVRAEIRAQEMRRRQAAAQRSARLRRPTARRTRAFAALAALVGVLGTLVGIGLAVAGSGAALLVCSALLAVASVGGLVLLAPGRVHVPTIPAEQVLAEDRPIALPEAEPVATGTTEDAAAAHAAAQRAAADRIARARSMARARAERPNSHENQTDSILLREVRAQVARERAGAAQPAQAAPAAETASAPAPASDAVASTASAAQEAPTAAPRRAPMSPAAAQQRAAQHRLRGMGVIGDTSEGMPDLDAVLRRRRNAG